MKIILKKLLYALCFSHLVITQTSNQLINTQPFNFNEKNIYTIDESLKDASCPYKCFRNSCDPIMNDCYQNKILATAYRIGCMSLFHIYSQEEHHQFFFSPVEDVFQWTGKCAEFCIDNALVITTTEVLYKIAQNYYRKKIMGKYKLNKKNN